jgi:hypothetical protein
VYALCWCVWVCRYAYVDTSVWLSGVQVCLWMCACVGVGMGGCGCMSVCGV